MNMLRWQQASLIVAVALGSVAGRCRPGNSLVECGTPPAGDVTAPRAAITIEVLQGASSVLLGIGSDTTVNVSQSGRFNIAISGNDEGYIRSLALGLEWTEWSGSLPRLVQPLVAPQLFDVACTPRFDAQKFTWQGAPRAYRFEAIAFDYAENQGRSPRLTVVHGTPPGPINPP